MPDVTIYGASDDLIEVEGDVPGCDEYNQESAVPGYSARATFKGVEAVELLDADS